MNILNPIEIPRYVSASQAIRTALGKLGMGASQIQAFEPDMREWAIEASDMISKPKTFKIDQEDFEVCGNKIMLGSEVLLVECATANGQQMEYITNRGCNRCTASSPNRCCRSNQKFYIDECYMHFTPSLKDGDIIHVESLKRAIGEDGYPMILDSCNMAISEYIAAMICARTGDNRFALWHGLWTKHVVQARAGLNRITQAQIENLGALYDTPFGGRVTFGNFAYYYGNVWAA